MNLFKTSFAALVLLVWSTAVVYAQHEWKEAEAGGYKYKYVTNDPMQARFYTLANGMTIILSPTNKEPRLKVYFAVKAGAKNDPAEYTGLAHYLEHMLFKGTTNYGTLDWEKEKPYLDQIDSLYNVYNHTTDKMSRYNIYRQIDVISGQAAKWAITGEYYIMMGDMGSIGTNASTTFESTVFQENIPANCVDKFLSVEYERFRNPVFRLFHTEVETINEEKIRALQNDSIRTSEALLSGLFKNHNYGKQTIMGSVENLRNPSLAEIKKYYNTYYVPNNMGIVISGDFNPDELIIKLDKYFGRLDRKTLPKFQFEPEEKNNQHVEKEIASIGPAFVVLGYRMPGTHEKDALLANVVLQILANGKSGLIDLNLVKKQKLLRANAQVSTLVDYGYMTLTGYPTLGQSANDAKTLLLGEIEHLKNGTFDDDVLVSIVNNAKKSMIRNAENYRQRADLLVDAFVSEEDWSESTNYMERLSRVTKKDITDFAKKYFDENYVAVFKLTGKRKNEPEVENPDITAVETNSGTQSHFAKAINSMPVTPGTPVFLDYDKDIQKDHLGPVEVLYTHNNEDELFRLRYRYKIGNWNDRRLEIAATYLQFLGTAKKTSEEITKEFYKMGCSFKMIVTDEYTTIVIDGLQENFDKAIALYDDLIANCVGDEAALTALKAHIEVARAGSKMNSALVLSGLVNYARYGVTNPFNYVLNDDELKKVSSAELVELLHAMTKYNHRILYYGPLSLNALTTSLKPKHFVPSVFTIEPAPRKFIPRVPINNEVLFADYNISNSITKWIRNVPGARAAQQPVIEIFNKYLSGSTTGVLSETLQSRNAASYSTNARYVTPYNKVTPFYLSAYVNCDLDKFKESFKNMNALLTELPNVDNKFELAKSLVKKEIETERFTPDEIIDNYLIAEQRGLNSDIRKFVYANVDNINFDTIEKFHGENISNQPFSYCIIASSGRVNKELLSKYGEYIKLTSERIFGY